MNDYARRNNILKDKDSNLTGEDIREGITAIVSVKLPEPQFEGQTKTKLGNTFMRGIVDSIAFVRAVLNPDRWTPPSCVFMLLANEYIFSL